jgi:hypothetical protein
MLEDECTGAMKVGSIISSLHILFIHFPSAENQAGAGKKNESGS